MQKSISNSRKHYQLSQQGQEGKFLKINVLPPLLQIINMTLDVIFLKIKYFYLKLNIFFFCVFIIYSQLPLWFSML